MQVDKEIGIRLTGEDFCAAYEQVDVSSPIIIYAYRALIAHQAWIAICYPQIRLVPALMQMRKPCEVLVAKQDGEKLHALLEGHPESRMSRAFISCGTRQPQCLLSDDLDCTLDCFSKKLKRKPDTLV